MAIRVGVTKQRKDRFSPRVSFSLSSVSSIQHLGCVHFHLALGMASGMEARVGTLQ